MRKFNAICLIILGVILLTAAIVDCVAYRNQIIALNKKIDDLEIEVKYYKIMEELDDKIQKSK